MSLTPGRRACSALAIAAYLIVSLFTFRNVLSSPSTLLPYPSVINDKINMVYLDHWDQAMVITTVVRNANLLVTRPWDLFADVGQCFPMPGAYTLGEHMFGVGLLAALPYALTGDPILSYNFALVLTLWIPAITMYFLALRFTRSPGAAFVAGLAFALVPGRLIDPSHPYVHGDLWAPAVLLFLHRLFVSGKWRDALGLAFFLNLEVFESLYPLISTCLLASAYGIYLLFRHRTKLAVVLTKLAFALALTLVGVWIVLVPYLETSASWELLSGRASLLLTGRDFMPGQGDYFPGFIVLFFVAIAMLDRLRGPRLAYGEDPRLAFFLGGLLIAWCSVGHVRIPALGFAIESPFLTFRDVIPGLSAVRALASVAIGTGIASSFLIGFAVLALTERLRPVPWGPATGAAVCAFLLLSFRFVPPLAEASFGRTFRLTSYIARPPQEDIDLIRKIGRGPQLDFPLSAPHQPTKRLDIADALLLSSYDPRPMAACYNSFQSPVNDQVIGLAQQLPSPTAAEALGALGFETLLVNRNRSMKGQIERFDDARRNDPNAMSRLQPLGQTKSTDAYRLTPLDPVATDFRALEPAPQSEPLEALVPVADIEFLITNRATATFRHPEPLGLSDLVLQWRTRNGLVAHEQTLRALLPIALGRGGEIVLPLHVTTPDAPGHYDVVLHRTARPDQEIGRRKVFLRPLEEVMSPSEIAMHMNREYVKRVLVPHGTTTIFPPIDAIEMLLGPGVTSAAELRGHGKLAAHWFNGFDEISTTEIIDADVEPTGTAGWVLVRLPIPTTLGLYTLLITSTDDPRTILAGKMVFPDVETARALEAAASETP